jgi:hypothetical protein
VRCWKAARAITRGEHNEKFVERRFLEDIEMANGTSVAGTWAYRSYINTSDQPVFGAGLFTFQTPTATTLTGTFDIGSDLGGLMYNDFLFYCK